MFPTSNNRLFKHSFANKHYEVATWELFLPSNFQSDSWYIVILKERSIVLAAIEQFHKLFVPLGLLFFLCSAYAIYLFIKKQMSPLAQLTHATQKIANGIYDLDLPIDSDDEFKNLGDSFVTMAASLSHQNQKDETFADLEQSVLMNPDLQDALKSNIESLTRLIDSPWLVIAYIDAIEPSLMHTHSIFTGKKTSNLGYTYATHNFMTDNNNETLYSVCRNEFIEKFKPVSPPSQAKVI